MQDGSVYNAFRWFLLFTGRDGVLCYLQDHPAYNHFGYTQDGPAKRINIIGEYDKPQRLTVWGSSVCMEYVWTWSWEYSGKFFFTSKRFLAEGLLTVTSHFRTRACCMYVPVNKSVYCDRGLALQPAKTMPQVKNTTEDNNNNNNNKIIINK